jgi:hypothetical protein
VSKITVYLTASGSGERYEIGVVDNLEEATELIHKLDKRYYVLAEESMDFQEEYDALPETDPLKAYEGCDIYAESEDGEHWMMDSNGEEPEVITWELA